jgi:hypothetical protein
MTRITAYTAILVLSISAPVLGATITNVVETGGDNEATDTITAKWTGQTFPVSVANEPIPGATVGQNYTVGTFGNLAPAYVDRNHRYAHHSVQTTGTLPTPPNFQIPAYLIGGEYIMSGNDNRDNNPGYRLDVTIGTPATAYLLIDNRMSVSTAADDPADPPTFDATHMQWVVDNLWLPTTNGLNRLGDVTRPDEVPIDEGADNTINNWFSVYRHVFPAGTFSLFQPDNGGQNMYGVVVIAIPEPATALLLVGLMASLFACRSLVRCR